MKRRHLLALLPSWCGWARAFASEADTGIVLLHGKQSSPGNVGDIARLLRRAGCQVETPEMAWSQRREFDVPYPAALKEVAAVATKLQAGGAKRIIVGGHSLGANAALAYAASGRPVAGVFALSPGHVPEGRPFGREVAPGVQKAREMIDRGAGDEKAWFPDSNQGRTRQVHTSANAYLSYFDPHGPASLMHSCRRIPQDVPLFMSVGEAEGILPYARDRLFTAAPRNEHSVFVAVPGDHFSAPRAASGKLVEWVHVVAG